MASVGVIDIGSNTIKALVAERSADGGIRALFSKAIDARISAGISHDQPRLAEASMTRGVEAIRSLLDETARFAPRVTVLVATSAVRDAGNGADFRRRVREATGQDLRILSGAEEAQLIGRGLIGDPALPALRDFYVFDLGGGSLECLAFRERKMVEAVSLQLGCVRLTEKFVPDPAQPLPAATMDAIRDQVRNAVRPPAFRWDLPAGAQGVVTGGTAATVRAIRAERASRRVEETPTGIGAGELRALAEEISRMSLPERKNVPGLPAARADVFPAALITLATLAETGRFDSFEHSFYNLRFGLAAEALGTR